jgi:hypothetical protein
MLRVALLRCRTGVLCALVFTFAIAAPSHAALPAPAPDAGVDAARVLQAARVPSCVCEEEQLELARYRDLVAAAASVEEAREKATQPSRLARRALAFAGFVRRDADSIEATRARLLAYEERVARAPTAAAAADEFEGLVRVAGGDVKVGGSGGCNYNGTEIVAIVFGFLFFIIPGIILLIVFC